MNGHTLPFAQRAAELRHEFDRSFAEPPRSVQAASLDLLAIRLGGEPYALHLTTVSGLFAGKKFTRLPQDAPEFLGIAGFRGSVLPVYDLRVLLGCTADAAPRWLVVTASVAVGLAFDGFDGHLRLPQEGIAQQDRSDSERPHVRELARVACAGTPSQGDPLRPIVDVASILMTIRHFARQNVTAQQQE